MPIYEYRCVACGRVTETLQRIDDPPPPGCPHCGGELQRMVSAPAFQFKGSGWYVSDYGGKSRGSESAGEAEGGAKKEPSSEKSSPAPGAGEKASPPSTSGPSKE